MKKIICLVVLLAVMLSVISCGHEHEWEEATCTSPKKCISCGTTEGVALEHSYLLATCTKPKTCSVCNSTEGNALGHTYSKATCTIAKTCSVCKATEGSALGHNFDKGVCVVCSIVDSNAISDQLLLAGEAVKDLEKLEEYCNALTYTYQRAWYFVIYKADDYLNYNNLLADFSSYVSIDEKYINDATISLLEEVGMETTQINGLAALRTVSTVLKITEDALGMIGVQGTCTELSESALENLKGINAKVVGEDLAEAVLDYCNAVLNYYVFAKSPTGNYSSYGTSVSTYKNHVTTAKRTLSNEIDKL